MLMIIILGLVFWIAILRVFIATDKLLLCSGVFTALLFFTSIVCNVGDRLTILRLLIVTVLRFGLSTLFLWGLRKSEDITILWWLIFIVSVPIFVLLS